MSGPKRRGAASPLQLLERRLGRKPTDTEVTNLHMAMRLARIQFELYEDTIRASGQGPSLEWKRWFHCEYLPAMGMPPRALWRIYCAECTAKNGGAVCRECWRLESLRRGKPVKPFPYYDAERNVIVQPPAPTTVKSNAHRRAA